MEKRLKVLIYSHFFYPSVGGLETVSMSLAAGFIKNGLECKIVTTSIGQESDDFGFEVIRKPNFKKQIQLVKWADVVLYNGASMALQPWVLFYRRPFVWIHVGYQVSCIDGLGWVEGQQAPLTPFRSFLYHSRLKGWVWGLKEGLKLAVRRALAYWFVSKNIAITTWMEKMQPLPRQVQIYNPFPIASFLASIPAKTHFDFIYVGRIVSEKGVETLLKAFSLVVKQSADTTKLLLIGDGLWKDKMAKLADELKISDNVTFEGSKSGEALVQSIAKGNIAVVPSEWYEPMGGVVLELMAAGKSLIVSEFGGLKECAGAAALTFPNGDYEALAACMTLLLENKTLRKSLEENGKNQLIKFDPEVFINEYMSLLTEITQ